MTCIHGTEEDVHRHCILSHLKRGWKVAAHEWIVIPRKENRTSEGLKKFVEAEIGKWAPIMKEAASQVK